MKTRNEKTKNLVKGIVFGLFVVALLALVTGCDKKKSNNNTAAGWWGNGYGYGHPGYGGYGSVSNISAGVDMSGRFMLILETATDPYQTGYGTSEAYVRGEMRVYTPIACLQTQWGAPAMGLDAGVYRLEPYNGPAILNVDLLTNVALVASGPYSQALVTIPYARFFQTNVCGFEGMMGLLNVEQINGQPCGLSMGFTDQMTNPGMCGY